MYFYLDCCFENYVVICHFFAVFINVAVIVFIIRLSKVMTVMC